MSIYIPDWCRDQCRNRIAIAMEVNNITRDATEDDTGGAFPVSRHEPPR